MLCYLNLIIEVAEASRNITFSWPAELFYEYMAPLTDVADGRFVAHHTQLTEMMTI